MSYQTQTQMSLIRNGFQLSATQLQPPDSAGKQDRRVVARPSATPLAPSKDHTPPSQGLRQNEQVFANMLHDSRRSRPPWQKAYPRSLARPRTGKVNLAAVSPSAAVPSVKGTGAEARP